MYIKIITNKNLSFRQRIKNLISYFRRRRVAKNAWAARYKKLDIENPNYQNPIDKRVETEHLKYWAIFNNKINLDTIRVCSNISGKSFYKIIPEEIFVADIEPSLNIYSSVDYISNKSFYNLWFPGNKFPNSFLHKIDGVIYNHYLQNISEEILEELIDELKFPLILKPNRNSYGGQNIFVINNKNELLDIFNKFQNLVVQEKLNQHDFFAKFNPLGINSIRVYSYRSVKDNKIHILNMALRMGKGGSLDNETAGGIVCYIKPNGQLNGYAVDKYGSKFIEHPDTNYTFNEFIPEFQNLISESNAIAERIFYCRLIGLDACLDENSHWRFLEFNPSGHTIRFAQYAGIPFFNGFTDEVINFCRKNHWALSNSNRIIL